MNISEFTSLHNCLPLPLPINIQLLPSQLILLNLLFVDRGNDNWLIKYQKSDVDENELDDSNEWSLVKPPSIKVAAIDNGLAFPFKHPDEWRTCE